MLRFDAATHRAVVWVDETQVAEHEGGYTPFEADITDLVEPGGEIRITAVVNNVLSWHSIPPGYVEETPDGRRQRYFHDFFNYAGHPPHGLALHDAHGLRPRRDRRYGPGRLDRERPLRGRRREATTSSERARKPPRRRGRGGRRGDGRTRRAHRRGRPSLAPGRGLPLRPDRRAAGTGDRRRSTSYSLPVGIRTVRVDGARFLINGEPFYFSGFGKHEDSAVRGKAPRRRVHGPRLRADGVARRELVPHLPLPVRGGGARVRRPARHRRHRRDRRGRAQRPARRRARRRSRSRRSPRTRSTP